MPDQESFGGSSRDINEQALTAVADFLQAAQPGCMVQKFVLIVETIDGEDRWMSAFTAPGQKRWDSLGLLSYATVLESNVVLGPDTDDP